MTIWLINPGKRNARMRGKRCRTRSGNPAGRNARMKGTRCRTRKGNPSPAQRAARARFAAAARAGRLKKGVSLNAGGARRLKRKSHARRMEAGSMATRKKRRRNPAARKRRHRRNPSMRTHRRKRRRSNPVRASHHRRRRGHRRNPSIRGIGGQVLNAAKRAGVIVVSEAAINQVSGMLPVLTASPAQIALKQAGIGIALSMIAKKFAPRYAEDVLVAALLGPITTLAKGLPVIGAALSGAPPGLGLYNNRSPRALRGAPPGLGRVGLYRDLPKENRLFGMKSYMDITPGVRSAYYD